MITLPKGRNMMIINNKIKTILGIGDFLLIILGAVDMLINNSILPQGLFRLVFYCFAAIFIIISLVAFLIPIFKPLYTTAQIKSFNSAKHSIYVSIHSLNPESANPIFRQFNEALEDAKNQGKTVRLMAPCGIDRVRGAYEMHSRYDFDKRFLEELEDEDLRHTLIDDNISIISYQKVPAKKLSRKFAYIKSERLNKLLKGYFEKMWEQEGSLTFEQFLRDTLDKLNVTKDEPSSIKRASERLGIAERDLKEFL